MVDLEIIRDIGYMGLMILPPSYVAVSYANKLRTGKLLRGTGTAKLITGLEIFLLAMTPFGWAKNSLEKDVFSSDNSNIIIQNQLPNEYKR